MNTRGCKAKGREFQKSVRDLLREYYKDELDADDINCTLMSENGVDIKLTPSAKKLIPFDIECKNQKAFDLTSAIKQAESNNTDSNRIPLVVFKKNYTKTYCVIEFETFIKLTKQNKVREQSFIKTIPDKNLKIPKFKEVKILTF